MFTTETKKATITNAVGNGTAITYTASNTFKVGDIVHISGLEPANLNIPDAVVATRSSTQFTVLSTEVGTRTKNGVAVYDDLKNHLISTSVINTQTKVIGEWNLNAANNILKIGNYRHLNDGNPGLVYNGFEATLTAGSDVVTLDVGWSTEELVVGQQIYQTSEGGGSFSTSGTHITEIVSTGPYAGRRFKVSNAHETTGAVVFDVEYIPSNFIEEDSTTFQPGYYGATDADVVVNGGVDDEDQPYIFSTVNEQRKMIYSLEDCFGKFRPRSGINKLSYFPRTRKIERVDNSVSDLALGARYYAASRYDKFKYWTSFRTVNRNGKAENVGVSSIAPILNVDLERSEYLISDTAPFVVYRNKVAANRIVIKMQTHVSRGTTNFEAPAHWSIEKLDDNNQWTIIADINYNVDKYSSDYIKVADDGYFELEYGVDIPDEYSDVFYHAGEYANANNLPATSFHGYAYLVGASKTSAGNYYIWDANLQEYVTPFDYASYSWKVSSQSVGRTTPLVTDVTSPDYYEELGTVTYRELDFMKGLRVVVHSMHNAQNTFDLIEMSPRLAVDLSDKTTQFSITKNASDLGNSGMPVGQLLSSVGSISIFDYDQAFNQYNVYDHEAKTGSVIANLVNRNLQIKFYEITKNVGLYDYYMPLKTMYAEGFPQTSAEDRSVTIELKDQFIAFESFTAPELFIPDASLSYAIAMLLDSIGFSNYIFKRVEGQTDPTIPFFFVGPDTSVAEVLSELAVSTQHAMFFDEYNNFVIMSNEYMMPSKDQRDVDAVLYGSKDYESGDQNTKIPNKKLSNILQINSEMDDIYNDGKIAYKARSIQKAVKDLKQSYAVDEGRTWVYKPVLLWEAPDNEEARQSVNEENNRSSGYALTAIPLNSDLSADVPEIVDNAIINNIINLGKGAYWIPRYNGYFYSNGEIIRYDAIEYIVEGIGSVWLTSVLDYKNYFSKLEFNKKIYPSGRVRIYSKLDETGQVIAHGRGQFGTEVTTHTAGMDPYWSDKDNRRGVVMKSNYLFGNNIGQVPNPPANLSVATVGTLGNTVGKTQSKISNKIKNVLITVIPDEKKENVRKTKTSSFGGNVQASALVFQGPAYSKIKAASTSANPFKPRDLVSYVYKPLDIDKRYVHFGTRMRITGKIADDSRDYQIVHGGTEYYPAQDVKGGSGGIAIMINPTTNAGYYFEVAALSYTGFGDAVGPDNVFFYKLVKNSDDTETNPHAIPVRMFSANIPILTDDGEFVGQSRALAEKYPTVYDLAIEYKEIGESYKFYLYINGKQIATVDDDSRTFGPKLPTKNNMALFVRASSNIMFENVYALGNRHSLSPAGTINTGTDLKPIFRATADAATKSTGKYALSGIIQEAHLGTINPQSGPNTSIYYDEFGTIMREMAYFNIKYDKAYPALFSKLAPVLNSDSKGYVVSGFNSGAYGAEFMIFNATDTVLNLDSSTGNYLRIQGVTFNQESNYTLTVDEYYNKISDFSNPTFSATGLETADSYNAYVDIKNSRTTYGTKSFSLEAPYLQTQDDANNMMKWLMSKISKPRRAIGVSTFGTSYIQLGDILNVRYSDENGIDQYASEDARYVVYSIQYRYGTSGPETILFLSEVS